MDINGSESDFLEFKKSKHSFNMLRFVTRRALSGRPISLFCRNIPAQHQSLPVARLFSTAPSNVPPVPPPTEPSASASITPPPPPSSDSSIAAPTSAASYYWGLLYEIREMRSRGWKVLTVVGLVIGSAVALIYANLDRILYIFGRHGATVAQVSIGDPSVQSKVQELSKQVVQDLLVDPRTLSIATTFVQQVLATREVRESAANLTMWVLNEQATLNTTQAFAKRLLEGLMSDPQIIAQVGALLVNAILLDSSREGFAVLVQGAFADPHVQARGGDLLGASISTDEVRLKAFETASHLSQKILTDPIVIAAAQKFVTDVIQDQHMQQSAGDAVWNAISFSVIPSFLRSSPKSPVATPPASSSPPTTPSATPSSPSSTPTTSTPAPPVSVASHITEPEPIISSVAAVTAPVAVEPANADSLPEQVSLPAAASKDEVVIPCFELLPPVQTMTQTENAVPAAAQSGDEFALSPEQQETIQAVVSAYAEQQNRHGAVDAEVDIVEPGSTAEAAKSNL